MKASMLKEFGHFHPEVVQVISYVVTATRARNDGRMSC